MGLFDEVTVLCELPENAPEFVRKCPVFQTYDLGRGANEYEITEDREFVMTGSAVGLMLATAFGAGDVKFKTPVPFKRKRLELYTTNGCGGRRVGKTYMNFTKNGEPYVAITYVVQIRSGFVSSIKEKSRVEKPALPKSRLQMREEPER